MNRNGLIVFGLSEVRKDIVNDGTRMTDTEAVQGQGVAILLKRKTSKQGTEIVLHSERLILVRVQAVDLDYTGLNANLTA